MEYDIDIEEHDVLSKVQINATVPDLSIVKNEILDSDCQLVEYMQIDDQQYQNCTDEYYRHFDHSASSPHENNRIERGLVMEHEYPWVSKMILGNKPNSINSSSESAERFLEKNNHGCFDSVLLLEDWGPRLKRSECFCKECLILFPTPNSLESHNMSAHSLLVPHAVHRNKAIKSTSGSKQRFLENVIEQQNHPNREAVDSKKLCKHCNEYFADENTLFQHLYEILPNSYDKTNCQYKLDRKQIATGKRKIYCCDICSCYFALITSVRRHVRHNHKTTNKYSKQSFKPQCCFCKHSFQQKYYNSHIKTAHYNMYRKGAIKNAGSNAKYSVSEQSNIQKNDVEKEVVKKTTKTKKRSMAVFKCKLCLLHFTSTFKASNHRKRCSGIISKKINPHVYSCKFCKLKFRIEDLTKHEKEHNFANFKVLEAGINKIILYKCPKCNLYYEDSLNRAHESKYCDFNKKYRCNICEIDLSSKRKSYHKQCHVDGLSKADFILLDGFDQSSFDSVSSDTDSKLTLTTILYCNKCGCCLTTKKVAHFHVNGNCKNIRIGTNVICSYCGLKFNKYSMNSHLSYHRKNFNLNFFKFLLLPNMRQIKPVIPKYVSCNKCGVHIINSTVEHFCSNEFVVCEKCNKKFSTKDYELHRAFHEYSLGATKSEIPIPTAVIKNIIPEENFEKKVYIKPKHFENKLYKCPICNAFTDNIHSMKRHFHHHAKSRQKIRVTHCRYCNLKFERGCLGRHEKLHQTNKFFKSKIKIIKFSRADTNIQNCETEDATANNKPKIVFYKCTKCNCAFPRQMYLETHICTKTNLKSCERCNLNFPAKDIHLHNILHKKTPKMTAYLSIIDYNPNSKIEDTNEKNNKIAKQTPKCPCGYRNTIQHLLKHYDSCAVAKRFPKILAEIKAVQGLNKLDNTNDALETNNTRDSLLNTKDTNDAPLVANDTNVEKIELIKSPPENTLFKCSLCKTLFFLNSTVIKHLNYCTGNHKGVKCDGCGLVYHSLMIYRHRLNQNCEVLAKNKNIIEVFKNDADLLRTVYGCDDCDVFFMTKNGLIEHRSNGHKVNKSGVCKLCKLTFIDLDSHCDIQHFKVHLDLKDLRVVTLNDDDSENIIICKQVATKKFKIKLKKPTFKPRRHIKTESDSESENKIEVEANKDQKTLYKCAKCFMHFIEWSELFAHVLKTTHNPNGDVDEIHAKCSFCCKSFGELTLPVHIEKHHKTRKQLDFMVDTDVSSSRIIDYMATLKKDGNDPVAKAICDISSRFIKLDETSQISEASEDQRNVYNKLDKTLGDHYVNGNGTGSESFEEDVIIVDDQSKNDQLVLIE